jgi:hypothetical protein
VGSEVFIGGSRDIKLERDITWRATYKRVEGMWAQKYLSRDAPNIKHDRHIRLGSRFETHTETNIIDMRTADITRKTENRSGMDDFDVINRRSARQETQTYSSRDLPMSYLSGIEDHGSNKLALYKFANADSMAFLGMVLLLGSMIFDQVAYTTASTLTHSGARFSTTHFADTGSPKANLTEIYVRSV